MRDLEEKEKELNKLKVKADGLVNNNHPASDKIQVRCFLGVLPVLYSKLFSGFVLMTLCAPTGLHGHLADPVELASPDHQVYPCSFEGECCLQPSKSSVLLPVKIEPCMFSPEH